MAAPAYLQHRSAIYNLQPGDLFRIDDPASKGYYEFSRWDGLDCIAHPYPRDDPDRIYRIPPSWMVNALKTDRAHTYF